MPNYNERAEELVAYVGGYGQTTYSVNAVTKALLEAYEAGLAYASVPAQPIAAPPAVSVALGQPAPTPTVLQ